MYLQTIGDKAPIYRYYSSFNKQEITRGHYVLTVFSGSSSWTGGHAAMFLEHFVHDQPLSAETLLIDLTVQGATMKIRKELVQSTSTDFKTQVRYIEDLKNLPKGGDPNLLAGTNHRCYDVDAAQIRMLLRAVDRFDSKVKAGRYTYSIPGGALGYIGSTIGHRGVNCADFVLKVLNESGIGNRYNGVINTPMRLAKSR